MIPLRTSKGILGVIDIQSEVRDAFSEQDRRALVAFAVRATVTMENVLLVDEIRRYAQELEERVSDRTAELNRVKDRVEAVLNNSSDGILLVGADGKIQQTNQTFNAMFDYSVDAIFGQPLTVIADADFRDALATTVPLVVNERRVARLEVKAITRTGLCFDADVMMSPIMDEDKQVVTIVCSLRDITGRKRVEKELRKALDQERELSEMKSRFITTASHQFRTPLAMIMTSSDILKLYEDKLSPEQRRDRVERIQAEVKNMTGLLEDLLTLSQADERGRFEFVPAEVDAKALCEQVIVEMVNRSPAARRIQFQCRGERTTGYFDVRLLRRIFVNLLSNALKFSDKDSPVEFQLSCEPRGKVFEIRDHGIGIPTDDQERLFEVFHRGKNVENVSGIGLGLAVVKRAVDAHGGTITFSSKPDTGTTFIVAIGDAEMKEGYDEQDPRY